MLLGEENNLKVYYGGSLKETPAFQLFSKIYNKSIDDGHSNRDAFNLLMDRINQVKVVYCCEGEKVIAGIAFEYRQLFREGWICFTFTDEAYRGRSINKLLRKYLENLLRKMGAKNVCSYIHKDNISSLNSSRKAGSTVEYYKTSKKLI